MTPTGKRIPGLSRKGERNPLNRRKKPTNYFGNPVNKDVIIRVGDKWKKTSVLVPDLRGLTGGALKNAGRLRKERIERWGKR